MYWFPMEPIILKTKSGRVLLVIAICRVMFPSLFAVSQKRLTASILPPSILSQFFDNQIAPRPPVPTVKLLQYSNYGCACTTE
jgi:hypothetical protein